MDFFEGLPKLEGKDTIMVILVRFTKFGHFIAKSRPFTAQEVEQLFMDHLYELHGLPATILNDRDKVFISLFWRELLKKVGVELCMS
jgi:hypothetical protein